LHGRSIGLQRQVEAAREQQSAADARAVRVERELGTWDSDHVEHLDFTGTRRRFKPSGAWLSPSHPDAGEGCGQSSLAFMNTAPTSTSTAAKPAMSIGSAMESIIPPRIRSAQRLWDPSRMAVSTNRTPIALFLDLTGASLGTHSEAENRMIAIAPSEILLPAARMAVNA
jgi:hypothetical protein